MSNEKIIAETDRLIIRELTLDDAEFIFTLVNQPSFLQFIGDKGVRTLDDARDYIRNGPMPSYEKYGFGSFCVTLKDSKTPIGMSGLIKREALDRPDIGFAILPEYWRNGYAYEAAKAIVDFATERKLYRICAIVNPENTASTNLLERLGFHFERMVQITDDAPEIKLFQKDLMSLNKIHQVAAFARDLDEATAFYRDTLGATFLARFEPPGLLFFNFNGTRLLLEMSAPKATVYFRVENIHETHEELSSKGVKFITEPHMIFRDDNGTFGDPGEEEWMAFFSDPSENTLAIASRVRKSPE